MATLTVRDVVKDYPGHRALDHVSLDIPHGIVYGLLGPNGAGKTTLIRILNRIIAQDSGKVMLDGHVLTDDDVRSIGYLPEERGLYKKMKVADHLVFLGRLRGMSRNDARTEAMKWLERMQLESWADKSIEKLSKGMAQKVQFIGTVLHRPQLLIFDEPFSGFDPVNAEQLKQEILRLNGDGATIIFSTHNMGSVEEVCDSFSLINHSRVVLDGAVADVRRRFSRGTFRVSVSEPVIAPDEKLYTIESLTAARGGGCEALVHPVAGATLRDVVSALNSRYTMRSFEEVLPSMHEIFIETVTSQADEQK